MREIRVPILLIGFNRPQYIRKIIYRLREFKPQKLYVSIDGARVTKSNDKELIKEVKSIVQNITWPCETHYLFHETNVGAEINVSNAISWVLEKEEYVIVNEDDILAPYSFYRFMQDMLIRYKDDERIAMVSGVNYTPSYKTKYDYIFTQMGHISGWGTWKRVWDTYNINDEITNQFININYLNQVSANKEIAKRRKQTFTNLQKNGIGNNSWDFMFAYYRIKNNLLSIVPKNHLTTNIGIDGLHSNEFDSIIHMRKADDKFIVSQHPPKIEWDKKYDIYHYEHYINPSWLQKKYNSLKSRFLSFFKYNDIYIKKFLQDRHV